MGYWHARTCAHHALILIIIRTIKEYEERTGGYRSSKRRFPIGKNRTHTTTTFTVLLLYETLNSKNMIGIRYLVHRYRYDRGGTSPINTFPRIPPPNMQHHKHYFQLWQDRPNSSLRAKTEPNGYVYRYVMIHQQRI